MMFKCLLCFVFAVLPIQCLYRGEECLAGNQPGTCELLTACPHLLSEISRAGKPLPSALRNKLQRLGCGFDYNSPLVCCSQSNSNNQDAFTNKPIDRTNDIRTHRNFRLLPVECGLIEGDRIVGGHTTRLFEMPWMILLSYDSARGIKLSCGGTLITQWYVLTAAHCVSFLDPKLRLNSVVLGEYNIKSDPDCERIEGKLFCAPTSRNVSIDSVIPHPDYNPQKPGENDIALVRLAEPADLSLDNMKPVCLPESPDLQSERLEGLKGVVAGWGTTEDGLQSDVLLSVDLPIISNSDCERMYGRSRRIQSSQLCAGGVQDKDSCGGDSGGPLMYQGRTRAIGTRYVQRGIVSLGPNRCGLQGFPGIYTRVGSYMNWILDNLRG